jgi:hypothetical protein
LLNHVRLPQFPFKYPANFASANEDHGLHASRLSKEKNYTIFRGLGFGKDASPEPLSSYLGLGRTSKQLRDETKALLFKLNEVHVTFSHLLLLPYRLPPEIAKQVKVVCISWVAHFPSSWGTNPRRRNLLIMAVNGLRGLEKMVIVSRQGFFTDEQELKELATAIEATGRVIKLEVRHT